MQTILVLAVVQSVFADPRYRYSKQHPSKYHSNNRFSKQFAVAVGQSCNYGPDISACTGNYFLTCDPTTQRWTIQNTCANLCSIDVGAYNCNNNSGGGAPQPPPPNPNSGITVGQSCNTQNGDVSACNGHNFLTCDKPTQRWVLQNTCNPSTCDQIVNPHDCTNYNQGGNANPPPNNPPPNNPPPNNPPPNNPPPNNPPPNNPPVQGVPQSGGPCNTQKGDVSACNGNQFLMCSNGAWYVQNMCPSTCSNSMPSFYCTAYSKQSNSNFMSNYDDDDY
ncbi:hypothetical protein HDV01_006992 [Terramyces sp. JEL0728]|nr:hypothetical protein HDV01_006992 [Terramyces sp. JEL0728]